MTRCSIASRSWTTIPTWLNLPSEVYVSETWDFMDVGLIEPLRNEVGQRMFRATDLRRISIVIAAQNLGFSLQEIKKELLLVPLDRNLKNVDWQKISSSFSKIINQRIKRLTQLSDRLSGCIVCGCLSLKKCSLANPNDRVGKLGSGPRFLEI